MTTDPDLLSEPFRETLPVPLARPWLDAAEVEAAADVVRSGYLCQGPKVAQFEEAFAGMLGAGHAVAVSSGSAALLVAMQAMGVSPGDEVVAPDMTFISTATSAVYLGARPVLCDITRDDYGLCPAALERVVTGRTKVIVPVHYAGQTAAMDEINAIAERHGTLVLEDAAEAHLAKYRGRLPAGRLGHVAIFSFTPTKPMTTGEGGMIVTDNDELAERCRRIRNFGDEGKFAWHSLGFNFRMNEVAAAVGLCQLEKLPEAIRQRRANAAAYDGAFAGQKAIITPAVRTPEDCNYQLYTVRFRLDRLRIDRDEIIRRLAAAGVASRLYYPALHRMRVFEPYGPYRDEDYPAVLEFERTALSLPVFAGMTEPERQKVIEVVLQVVSDARR